MVMMHFIRQFMRVGSVVLNKCASLSNSHLAALIDLSSEESKSIDVYAIGFEEMVDLDAKNIVNARYVESGEYHILVSLESYQ